jgi:N-acetylglutamate synthase-like GNAT family acetyltransferase
VGLLKKEKLTIRDVNSGNIDDLVSLCISPDKRDDPLFIKGAKVKKKWATQIMKKHGNIAKLAYLDSKPIGLIQYQLNPEERVVEIACIFVPNEENLRRGIGESLLRALMEEMRKPQPALNNDVPLGFVTWAFQVPGRYSQHEFFQKMGFKRVKEDDPFLLYYPIKKGYAYCHKGEKFIPQKEDSGKALIFYDPSCPFSMYFSEKIKESVREVAPDLPVRMINRFEESEEVKKRGQVPACAVNGKPIKTFFADKENFQKEVKTALEPQG